MVLFSFDQKYESINEKLFKIDPYLRLWFPKTPFFETLCINILYNDSPKRMPFQYQNIWIPDYWNVSLVWCNQMGTVFAEMSSLAALTRHLEMKTMRWNGPSMYTLFMNVPQSMDISMKTPNTDSVQNL